MRQKVRPFFLHITDTVDAAFADEQDRAKRGREGILGFLIEHLQLRRSDPQDDLISELAQTVHEGEPIEDSLILGIAGLVLIAGIDTTWSAIGSSLWHLALHPDDSRRRDAASFFVVRNTARAKRRGWITSASASVDVNVQANKTVRYTFRWRREDDPDPAVDETGRLRDEGKLIEHEASPQPSNKD